PLSMVSTFALSVADQVERVGAYVGLASFFGLAALTILYFAQARELKRLREWAARPPELARELEARAALLAEPQPDAAPREADAAAAAPAATEAAPAAPAKAYPAVALVSAAVHGGGAAATAANGDGPAEPATVVRPAAAAPAAP